MTSPHFHIVVSRSDDFDARVEHIVRQINPDKTLHRLMKLHFSQVIDNLHEAQNPLLILMNPVATQKFWDKLALLRKCIPKLHIIYKCDQYKCSSLSKSVTHLPVKVTHIDYSCDIPREIHVVDRHLLFPECPLEEFERYMKAMSTGDFLHRDPDGVMCIYNGSTRRELPPKEENPQEDLVAQLKVLLERLDQVVTKPKMEPDMTPQHDNNKGHTQPYELPNDVKHEGEPVEAKVEPDVESKGELLLYPPPCKKCRFKLPCKKCCFKLPSIEKDKATGGILPDVIPNIRIPEYNMDKRIHNGQSSWSSFGDL